MLQSLFAALILSWITLIQAFPVEAVSPFDLERQLGSKEGIARLMPSFRDTKGHFKVPDPTRDLQEFLTAQQTLTLLIDQAESRALNRLSAAELQRKLSGAE